MKSHSFYIGLIFILSLISEPQAQWVNVYNPFSGYVCSLSYLNSNLYAGSKGNLYISENNGRNWTSINLTDQNTDICTFASSGNNIFAGTAGEGIYISQDNGNSWIPSNDGLLNFNISVIITVKDSVILAGTRGNGIFRSTNYGISWLLSNNGISNDTINAMIVTDSLIIAGSCSGNIYHSADAGINWNLVSSVGNYSISSFTKKEDLIFAGSIGGGVYISSDKGIQWSPVNNGIFNHTIVTITSKDSVIFAGAEFSGIFRSTNNGELWSLVNNGLLDSMVTSSSISDSNVFFGTATGGVFSSSDFGELWIPMNIGLIATHVNSFLTYGENIFAGTREAGILLSTDKGKSWTELNSGLTSLNVLSLAIDDSTIYASTWDSWVFKSRNFGKNWLPTTYVSAHPRGLASVSSVLYVATTSDGVLRSTDEGNTWQNFGLTYKFLDPIMARDSFVVTGSFIYEGVFLSSNYGQDWTSLGSSYAYSSIYTLNWSGNNIVAGIDNGMYFRSIEGDTTWVQKGPNDRIYSTATEDSIILTSSYSGVYLSMDWGENWTKIDSGFSAPIYALAIVGSELFAADGNNNIWKSSISHFVTGVKEISYEPISNFSLYQNYPNPFNPTTTIQYSIPEQSNVKIIIYDALGREVTTLVNEEKSIGNYTVEFNAPYLSNGIYFYQMRTNEFIQTKKMILLK